MVHYALETQCDICTGTGDAFILEQPLQYFNPEIYLDETFKSIILMSAIRTEGVSRILYYSRVGAIRVWSQNYKVQSGWFNMATRNFKNLVHWYGATLFSRNVILSNRHLPKCHIVECQLVESSYCRIVKLPKLYNVECHFIESVFNRTSFSRHII